MPLASPAWEPTPDDLDTLGDAGKRFVRQMVQTFDCSVREGVLLLEAGHCVDLLAAWRPLAATDRQAAKLTLATTKSLAALMQQLQVPR
jgi:hypothetical protein